MATKKSVSFMDALQQTATPYRKVMITPMRDPMTRMRNKLTDSIMAQITAIDAGVLTYQDNVVEGLAVVLDPSGTMHISPLVDVYLTRH